MTRLDALRGLYDAVKAGTLPNELVCPTYFEDDFDNGYCCTEAYHGSVDAALALFASKLPGWWCELRVSTRPRAVIGYTGSKHDEQADTPATALLLACLAALITIEEGKG
jgi:hypothetical protein